VGGLVGRAATSCTLCINTHLSLGPKSSSVRPPPPNNRPTTTPHPPPYTHTTPRYYKCLANIETRFPISTERGHIHLTFPWADAFRPTKKAGQANIHFEKAAVLFNLAAVLRCVLCAVCCAVPCAVLCRVRVLCCAVLCCVLCAVCCALLRAVCCAVLCAVPYAVCWAVLCWKVETAREWSSSLG